jgi:hypothetical protein
MSFIKQIFEKNIDQALHKKFTRYSLGEYERAYVTIKIAKDNFKIKTSADFANDFIKLISNNIKEDSEVSGKIIATRDFEDELDIELKKYSKRGKLYTAELDTTLTPQQLKNIYNLFKEEFLLLSIKSDEFKLTVGKSLPKPGGKIKENFCRATLPLSLLDEFAFDVKDFTNLSIQHTYKITDIEVPKEFEDDFEQARLHAKRKGTLIRTLNIDGKEEKKEINFSI